MQRTNINETIVDTTLADIPVKIRADGSAIIGSEILHPEQFLDLWYLTRQHAAELEQAACDLDRRIPGEVDNGYCEAVKNL